MTQTLDEERRVHRADHLHAPRQTVHRAADATSVNIAYLVNQYPQPSHSFIRREIAALEAHGVNVSRFTVRQSDGTLVDPRDQAEKSRARVVLGVGPVGLLFATLRTMLTRPGKFLDAFRLAWNIGRRSERGLPMHLVYLAEACVLLKWLADAKADHVHAHFGTNSTAVAMLCRSLGGPTYSFTCHGPEEFDKVMAIRLDEKIRRAAFVVAISEFGRSQLYRWCDSGDWTKIKVIRCGVDDVFLNDSTPLPPAPAEARFVCVGRLVPQKGQLILLEAAAKLVAEGIDLKLTFAGDGQLRPALQKRIDELNLASHVRIGGWMSNDQVRQEILASRAMVLPSFAEGLPVVIMEALALHRPVVTTRIAGTPELVEHGTCGWVVTAGSVQELTDALRDACRATPQQLAAMGEEGASRVRERHNAHTEAAKLLTLFAQTRQPPTSGEFGATS
jgi:glycosyltransferase involved in cell wall biosynthesis